MGEKDRCAAQYMSPRRRLASSARWLATSSAYRSTIALDFQPLSRIRSPSEPPDLKVVAESVPELVRGHARVPGLLCPAHEDHSQAGVAKPAASPRSEPDPVGVGEPVVPPGAQVDGQCPGRGGSEHDEASFAGCAGALERHQAEHRVLDQVGREGVHHHPEQFRAADALAAQDADDRVIAGGLEVACPAASGYFQKVVDELRPQRLGAALDLGVAVQGVCVGGGVLTLTGEEVEELDQVPLECVRSALPVLQVVLAEVPVEERGADRGEVHVDPVGGQPPVQVLAWGEVGADRLLFVRAPVAVVPRPQVVLEVGERRCPVCQGETRHVRRGSARPGGRPDVVARHRERALQRPSGNAPVGWW